LRAISGTAVLIVGAAIARISAQEQVKTLTLTEAEQIAIANSPRLSSAGFFAAAAGKVVAETRSARLPILNGAITGTGAETGTAVAAGALTTSSISSRVATGLAMSQLITDFGRTNNLTETARLRAAAQGKTTDEIRSLVRLETRNSFYQTLGSESVLQAAQAALDQRRTTLRQVSALAEALMKSTLDVSFAEVAVSEAELALYQAENDLHANKARLSAAMGFDREQVLHLSEDPLPPILDATPDAAIGAALRDRPDLEALGLNRDAAHSFALAEAKLRYPTIMAVGTAGVVPARDRTLRDTYVAGGVNITIPILNGGLFGARQVEAELRARAAEKDVSALALSISRDVQIAWLDASTAFRSLDVKSRLVAQATEALRLAQARYDNGLSGILELTQAQFNQTSAQIGAAGAKFNYLARRAALDYQMGALRQ
jgi:outer membrane protein